MLAPKHAPQTLTPAPALSFAPPVTASTVQKQLGALPVRHLHAGGAYFLQNPPSGGLENAPLRFPLMTFTASILQLTTFSGVCQEKFHQDGSNSPQEAPACS